MMARVKDGSVRGRIDLDGVMWLYNDNGAARVYKDCPLKNINPKGWVDSYRIPKYIYFLWRAHYVSEPMAFIQPHFWQRKYIGQEKDITVDSNCDKLELFVNGKSKGVLFPKAESFWTVTFSDIKIEQGVLSVKGLKDGKKITCSVVTAGEPSRVVLAPSHDTIDAARDSVVVVTADILGSNGVQVQGFSKDVQWSISGPATLVGPSEYTTDIYKNSESEGVWYITTPVSNVIRSTGEPGEIIVSAYCEGLKPGEARIYAKSASKRDAYIYEPKLDNANRKPVPVSKEWLTEDNSLQQIIAPATEDIKMEAGSEYDGSISNYLIKRNPKLADYDQEMGLLVRQYSEILKRNKGVLVADDYNFLAERFNRCVNITDFIRETSQPAAFREYLVAKYAEFILQQDSMIEPQTIKQWIMDLPAVKDCVLNKIDADQSEPGSEPGFAVDHDFTTAWQGRGNGRNLTLTLARKFQIDSVAINFVAGDKRKSKFKIEIADSNCWTEIYSGQSNGTTKGFEVFRLEPVVVEKIKITGFGNSENDRNGIYEIIVGEYIGYN